MKGKYLSIKVRKLEAHRKVKSVKMNNNIVINERQKLT